MWNLRCVPLSTPIIIQLIKSLKINHCVFLIQFQFFVHFDLQLINLIVVIAHLILIKQIKMNILTQI
jgi:hypothetical protein